VRTGRGRFKGRRKSRPGKASGVLLSEARKEKGPSKGRRTFFGEKIKGESISIAGEGRKLVEEGRSKTTSTRLPMKRAKESKRLTRFISRRDPRVRRINLGRG